MLITFIISSALLTLITLAPLLPSNHWTVRVWEFPRLQIVFLILINMLLMALLIAQDLGPFLALVIVNLCLLCYQINWIFPYTPFANTTVKMSKSSDLSSRIKVINVNVLMSNRDAHKLIALVEQHQPHLLVTLESNQWWQDALEPLHDAYPYRVNYPLDNLYGMHLFSRIPLSDITTAERVEQGVPSIHCIANLQNGKQIQCHFLHPAPPSPTENEESTERDIELLGLAREIANKQGSDSLPVLVSGDLNDVAWSPTTQAFLRISGLQDPRIGRGAYNTFHAQYAFARWPLDHIFHSEHFELVSLSRLSEIGSDHFPLLTEIHLK
ncbi:MAG: endonuclease/exonuclease/phosphatase family protein [Paraglaciecola sp.]|uniref:endonuclease/exonuclease/phosphatase family protein n=1 Tax=Paraglaciecola sp. TaxID=1920173 RepID=UPI00273D2965|nr:endonuclease/exonuclease/phosphatase family protein [Paraglaciecola sp.]MDP5032855.1 endonuclease/exonuclease/phosphatase family protein [Paraglaciecola sp.]MDP5131443.1 endonuclease/exonuclease/phosphatase family protein [Paraglaciecola sp.]